MLFTPYQLGPFLLSNRIVMPPMTRARAGFGDVATELMSKYYAQRATAGLIISEGTQISPQGKGYAWTPGIYNKEQIAGWKMVTKAVHKENGLIFAQLWHVGRISHSTLQPNDQAPVSSSDRMAPNVKVFIDPKNMGPANGVGEMIQHSKPRVLEQEEINQIIEDFVVAAKNAMQAGFDGIEIHAANGYLINQFIDSEVNDRSDLYGGSLVNRLRLLRQVTEAIASLIGKERVGVRLSPLTTLQGAEDRTPQATYLSAAKILNDIGVAYIHIAEADWEDAPEMSIAFKEALRIIFSGTLIYSGKYNKDKAEMALKQGWVDLIGFGRPFIANPDLPQRLQHDYPLAEYDPKTLFGGQAQGYTTYVKYSD